MKITTKGFHAKVAVFGFKKRAKRIKGKDALFGIWKDNPKTQDVTAYVDSLRGSTLTEFFAYSPLCGANLKTKRSRDTGRKPVKF